MKIVQRSLALIALCAVIGYSGLWYYQANRAQQALKEQIDELNKSGYGTSVQYDSMEKSGYPWYIQIGLVNPKIDFSAIPYGEVAVDVDGKMIATTSLFGGGGKVALEGKTYLTVPENEALTSNKFLVKGTISGEVDQIAPTDIRLVGSQLHIFSIVSDKEVPKMHVDYVSIEGKKKELSEKSQRISCGIDLRGLDFTALFKSDGTKQTGKLGDLLNQEFYSQKNDIDFEMDLSMELPTKEEIDKIVASPLKLMLEKLPTISIDLDKFRCSGKTGNASATMHFSLKEGHGKNILIHHTFEGEQKIADIYYAMLGNAIDQVKKQVSENASANDEQLGYLNAIQENIPLLKKIELNKCNFDWSVDFKKNGLAGKLILSDFTLANDSRGIYLHGELDQQGKTLNGELACEVHNYQEMIQDLVKFYNTVIVSLARIGKFPDAELNPIPAGVSDKVISALKYISDQPDATGPDLKITFSYKAGKGKVGTLSLPEFSDYADQAMADIAGGAKLEQK